MKARRATDPRLSSVDLAHPADAERIRNDALRFARLTMLLSSELRKQSRSRVSL
jgi:hypothetical protein